MSSQVVTLYKDEAKTNALYPRTKLSAISDDNGKALSENISKLNSKTRINYLKSTLQTQVRNGITCTNNGDGTYTLNGTATQMASFMFNWSVNITPNKKYKLIGCPKNTSLLLVAYAFDNNYIIDEGEGIIFTKSQNKMEIYVQANTGVTCNNTIVKPMLTDDLTATYDDFISYDNSLVTGSSQCFFGGIDTSRILASDVKEYTATEDCWLMAIANSQSNLYDCFIYIDDCKVLYQQTAHSSMNIGNNNTVWIPLKVKQHAITTTGSLTAFGIKR